MASPLPLFYKERHISYFLQQLNILPDLYTSLDTNRLSLVFFALNGLDLLGGLDKLEDKSAIIEWIYSLQVLQPKENEHKGHCGFIGGTFMGSTFSSSCNCNFATHHNAGHIAMTYFALASLTILGDNFSRVDRESIISSIRCLQRADGSFAATANGSESDMRFLYCACAVSFMLQDWSGVDKKRAERYIVRCQSYDCAIGLLPGQESHGGSTYCSVAALHLMGKLSTLDDKNGLLRWCLERQVGGFQGRRNKVPDTCYSFWVGASLDILGHYDLVDVSSTRAFHLERCQSRSGGFKKTPDHYPDVLHSCLSVCALGMMKHDGVGEVDSVLCMSKRASNWMKTSSVSFQ